MVAKNQEKNSVSLSVSKLLKSISDGLNILSLEELNVAISEILLKKKDKSGDIDQLINIVCKDFKITKKALKEKYSRDNTYSAKITLFVIMNKHLGMSKRSIAKIFNAFPNAINVAINHFENLNTEKFKTDNDFMIKYQNCLSQFLNKTN